MSVDKDQLKVGTTVYRDLKNGKRKTRTVTELWNGEATRRELSKWGIYLSWNTTRNWDLVAYTQGTGTAVKRCTRAGLARWATGFCTSPVVTIPLDDKGTAATPDPQLSSPAPPER